MAYSITLEVVGHGIANTLANERFKTDMLACAGQSATPTQYGRCRGTHRGGGLPHAQGRAGDFLQRPLRSRFQARLTRGVRRRVG